MKTRSSDRRSPPLACAAVGLALAAILLSPTTGDVASAAMVSGVLNEHAGPPAKGRQLHFENRLSGDMILAPTNDAGAFEADLAPGIYDLRGERGLVIKRHVVVDREAVNLGTLRDPPALDVRRPFQREGIAETVIDPVAPATANVGASATRLRDRADAAAAAPASAPTAQSAPAPIK
ncbi:MAG: hypothetical protein ACREQF_09160 [Candidatus Binataceae bacterium]